MRAWKAALRSLDLLGRHCEFRHFGPETPLQDIYISASGSWSLLVGLPLMTSALIGSWVGGRVLDFPLLFLLLLSVRWR